MEHARTELPAMSEVKLALLGPQDEARATLAPLDAALVPAPPEPRRVAKWTQAGLDTTVLARLRLYGDELALVLACERAVGFGVDHTALMCRLSRVTSKEVDEHVREIGLKVELRVAMHENVRRFVHFLRLLAELRVVRFEVSVAWICGCLLDSWMFAGFVDVCVRLLT